MRLLLDTHTLIWAMNGDSRLGASARGAIASRANEVFVSAASVWEASIKHNLGKFPEAGLLVNNPGKVLAFMGFTAISVSIEHAQLAGTIGGTHRDPFDRMLAAQARLEGMTLASADEVFDRLMVTRIWA